MNKRYLMLLVVPGILLASLVYSQEILEPPLHRLQENFLDRHATMIGLNCSACHTCLNPSFNEPCLKFEPHFFQDHGMKITSENQPPELVIIDKLEDKYGAVKFKHRNHMHMAELVEDCAECHHYIPPDIKKRECRDCHEASYVRDKLETISLNGIYHRKCLGCHVEWGKSTNCELCHVSKDRQQAEELGKELPQYRKIKRIESKLFVTRYFYGPFVFFDHKFHTEQKKRHCPECHVKQPCITCHYQDQQPVGLSPMARSGVHGTCRLCHDVMSQDSCTKCHSDKEKTTMTD
ncbi:cytochrome c3 family protein [candidate division KSB1 bacterium]|nr:cytochrome c3 family protein [candidate division KSB1 bacterium]